MKPRNCVLIFSGFLLCWHILSGQDTEIRKVLNYRSPLDIPLTLAGSFGEPRSNHLHTGLDFRTNGVEGLSVYSVEDGYVSRINISPYGYGYAVYIKHPDGYTSVYGHLSSFSVKINAEARRMQYAEKKFAVDFNLPPGKIKVSKGEVIGKSGNSGSSGGPHLHFEIRDEKEMAVSPHLAGIRIRDPLAPKIYNLGICDFSSGVLNSRWNQIQLTDKKGNYKGPPEIIKVNSGLIGLSVHVRDFQPGAASDLGIHHLKMWVNGELRYSWMLDKISFDNKRAVYSVLDYEHFERSHANMFFRLYAEVGNKLEGIMAGKGGGRISLQEGEKVQIQIEIADVAGNVSRLRFYLMRDNRAAMFNVQHKASGSGQVVLPGIAQSIGTAGGAKLNIPAGAIFDTAALNLGRTGMAEDSLPGFMLQGKVWFRDYAELEIPLSIHQKTAEKLVLVHQDKEKKSAKGGVWDRGIFRCRIREVGAYKLFIDTTAPVVKPINCSDGKELNGNEKLKVKVSDNLSGIKSVDVFVDGIWTLYRWDGKSGMIEVDGSEIQPGKHLVLFKVRDEVANQTEYVVNISR